MSKSARWTLKKYNYINNYNSLASQQTKQQFYPKKTYKFMQIWANLELSQSAQST